ncbi:MAG: hypothetical protein J5737_06335 [Bacteroidales bacterium]|nr:hypothetical protein [Bacteroidales bacterium]
MTFNSCNGRDVDPLVVVATPSADTLQAGSIVEFKIWTASVEGRVLTIDISAFNAETGRKQVEALSIDKDRWEGYWETTTPQISADTLRHMFRFLAEDSLGHTAEWQCPIVLYRPKI